MKKFEVEITETLQRTVTVEAASQEEAERMVDRGWRDGDYVLTDEDYMGVDFKTTGEHELSEKKMLDVLLVKPNEHPRNVSIGAELEDLQQAVGGSIGASYPFADDPVAIVYTAMRESLTELKQMEKTLNGKKELQRQVLAYSKTRPVRDGLKQQKNAKAKAAYRQKYESDFIIADAAARYFRENGISKLPSYKALQAEIETLIQEKNSGYNDYRAKREEYRRLQTVKGNIDQILHRERKPVKRQEQER